MDFLKSVTTFINFNIVQRIFHLGYKDEFKVLILSAIPIVLGNISQIFLPISSILFCGHIGPDELDGASLANTLINMCALVCVYGLTSACDTLFPQIFGGENKKKIGLILQKGILIGLISAVGSVALLLSTRNLMLAVSENKQVAILADQYLLVFLPSVFFYNIAIILSKYLQSQNVIFPVMCINVIVIVINAVLHYVLIFVFKLGIKGAAVAVDISTFLLMLLTFFYIYYTKFYLLTWDGWSTECLYEWKMYLKLAVPGLVVLLIEWSNFEIGTFLSSTLDEIQLGLMTIAQQYSYISFQIPYGIGIAANIRVGQLLGGNHPEQARNSMKVAYSIALMGILMIALILLSLSEVLPYVFTDDAEIATQGVAIVKFLGITHFFDAMQGVNSAILRAVGGQFYSSIFLFVGFYVFGSPVGISLLLKTPLKVYGFFIGTMFGITVLMFMQFTYIWRLNWKQIAEEAHKLGELENNQKTVELKTLTNPNFESEEVKTEHKPISTKIDIFAIEIKKDKDQDENENEEIEKNKLNFKTELIKKSPVVIALVILLIISIFTHDLVKYDGLTNNSTTKSY